MDFLFFFKIIKKIYDYITNIDILNILKRHPCFIFALALIVISSLVTQIFVYRYIFSNRSYNLDYIISLVHKREKLQQDLNLIVKKTIAPVILISLPEYKVHDIQGNEEIMFIRTFVIASRNNINVTDSEFFSSIPAVNFPYLKDMTPESKCINYSPSEVLNENTKLGKIQKLLPTEHILRCAIFNENRKILAFVVFVYFKKPTPKEIQQDKEYIYLIENTLKILLY